MAEEKNKKTVKLNRAGLPIAAYKGSPSTLCSGCGHDSITAQIIEAFHASGLQPHQVIKVSGIGCSSKTPAYFLGRAHGFNSVHGRMPSVATGANVANHSQKVIGVSGDGDTASIGLGQFCHLMRRNVEMIYIIENNGVYGLTKGQFSATADLGSVHKYGDVNEMASIDCCSLAFEMGCGFVARSFSADRKQLQALLQAAIHFKGAALIDVVSPCVTFNNHAGSSKSYAFAKEKGITLHEIDFIPEYAPQAEISVAPGEIREIELYDGSVIRLKKLDEAYDASDPESAINLFQKTRKDQLLRTGLIYFNETRKNLSEQLNLVEIPLAELLENELRPSKEAFNAMLDTFR